MEFLDKIRNEPFVNLYGRGIKPIDDKWDALSVSKYAIAYENYESDYYWTEKIADCFLSYTIPLYFGCNKIEDFFPENSFIQIDPKDKHINLFLKEITESNKWEENLDAISKARELVLNEYQLFPFLSNKIKSFELEKKANKSTEKELIYFRGGNDYFDNFPLSVAIQKQTVKMINKFENKFKK
jgi:hypothetical protein